MSHNANGMVLGSFLGDALALAPHWMYDPTHIQAQFGRVDRLLDPLPGGYHAGKRAGDLTHYGDQTLVLVDSLVAQGRFDLQDFSQRWQALFAPGYTGYRDGATKATLANLANGWEAADAGSTSNDLAGAGRIAPLVQALGQEPRALETAVRAQTRMTHNQSGVVDAAAVYAHAALRILGGTPPPEALRSAAQGVFNAPLAAWVERGLASAGQDTTEAIGAFGRSCHLEDAFVSVAHLVGKYAGDFREGLVANVMAGGDSAGRGLVVGMLLGAAGGMEALPQEWLQGLRRRADIERLWADRS